MFVLQDRSGLPRSAVVSPEQEIQIPFAVAEDWNRGLSRPRMTGNHVVFDPFKLILGHLRPPDAVLKGPKMQEPGQEQLS
jgi:hypothetical protein